MEASSQKLPRDWLRQKRCLSRFPSCRFPSKSGASPGSQSTISGRAVPVPVFVPAEKAECPRFQGTGSA